ncbi:MAG: UDP-4-amino-4-deoxy-L-arabinose--oxoglutarate aminotransferase [Anaerolineae bacterium]|nr:UDP-4-amino-4-deoxy-L-arabinose--oxoglutarate aminotransferase [Anaerolineae bacterium]
MNSDLAINGGAPVRDTFLPFGAPHLGEEEIAEVVATLRSGWIGTGPKTQRFETEFAEYVGSQYAISVNSCTAGLHLSLLVNDIGPGDEVITTAMTFAATANVIEHCGARPVFVDIDPISLNIDPAQIKAAITPRTRAIIPVHFGGLPCDLDVIVEIANQAGLIVIEDAAHAVGTRYNNRMIGSIGHLTNFSFYPNKNLTTVEGGMITTNNETWANKLQVYRLHGLSRDAWKRYSSHRLMLSHAILPGYKYNMTDVQASLGLHQLRKLERFLEVREQYASRYDEAFARFPGVTLQPRPITPGMRHGLHLYVLILDPAHFSIDRNEIINALLAENIGAALHYRALHTHPYYQEKYGYKPEDFPHAYQVGERILSLPLTPAMTDADVQNVIQAVEKVLTYYHVGS